MLPAKFLVIVILLGCLFIILGVAIAALIAKHNNRVNMIRFHNNRLQQDFKSLMFQEGERMMNQVSKEVHDSLGHQLTLLKFHLQKIYKQNTQPENAPLLLEALNQVSDISRAATDISHSSNYAYIKAKNLHSLIEDELERIKTHASISYDFNLQGTVKVLMPDAKLLVYRIAQQALSNALRHANCTSISCLIEYGEESFKMTIADNGRGISAEQMQQRKGIGLSNMLERAELLGGYLAIEQPIEGSGVTIVLFVEKMFYNYALR